MAARQAFIKLIFKIDFARKILGLYIHSRTSCYLVSYPKSGRTWIRVMLAKALALHFEHPKEIVFDPLEISKRGRRAVPTIRFIHGVRPTPKTHEDAEKQYRSFMNKSIILLVRDPSDVIVSRYYQRTRRKGDDFDLSTFIRDSPFSIDKIISFMNGWYEHKDVFSDFLLVRYEDVHLNPALELTRILSFLSIKGVSDKLIREAVDYASFDNMRKMSLNELAHEPRLAPANPDDVESYKVRRGKVGSYADYLRREDVSYIEERMRSMLCTSFAYIR